VQEAILALLAKEPTYGYELRQRLEAALGPAGGALNPGQVYVTLSRLERAGLVREERRSGRTPGRKATGRRLYELTAEGRQRVDTWLNDVTWAKIAPVEFHLKLVSAAATGLADPAALVDAQRLELLRRLRELQELARNEEEGSDGSLLIEGAALRLQADVRWLEACERHWIETGSR
jgi:DNA-binding PadR family transcriptional regulator